MWRNLLKNIILHAPYKWSEAEILVSQEKQTITFLTLTRMHNDIEFVSVYFNTLLHCWTPPNPITFTMNAILGRLYYNRVHHSVAKTSACPPAKRKRTDRWEPLPLQDFATDVGDAAFAAIQFKVTSRANWIPSSSYHDVHSTSEHPTEDAGNTFREVYNPQYSRASSSYCQNRNPTGPLRTSDGGRCACVGHQHLSAICRCHVAARWTRAQLQSHFKANSSSHSNNKTKTQPQPAGHGADGEPP